MTLAGQAFSKIIHWSNPFHILKNLFQHRNLIVLMTRRDIGQRYKGSYLGLLWAVINPLLMLLIYTFVFSVVFKARWRPTDEVVPLGEFAITLFAGLIPFNLFAEVVNRAPGLIFNYPNYVKKVVFPLEILMVVVTGTALFTSLVNLVILMVASVLFLHTLPATIILLPLLYVPLLLLSIGLGWFLAPLGVYVRDLGQAVPLIVQVLMFMSPVFFSASSVPENFQIVLAINPLSLIVDNFRQVLLWGQFFPLKDWAIWTAVSAVIAVAGYVWFMGTKKGFADVL